MSDTQPIVTSRRITATGADVDLIVPRELRYLRGHFSGAPIVPGVVQIKWVVDEALACFGIKEPITDLEMIKFRDVIRPETKIRLSLKLDTEKRKLNFEYKSAEGILSSGGLILRRPA